MNWNMIESFLYDISIVAVFFGFIIIVIVGISCCIKKFKKE
jgi:hypothetical protein